MAIKQKTSELTGPEVLKKSSNQQELNMKTGTVTPLLL